MNIDANLKNYLRPITILVTFGIMVSTIFIVSFSLYDNNDNNDQAVILKAAIIDQLYDDIPNENYHHKVTKYLEIAGYTVDLYTTKDITVDFYKKLPSMDYQFIVIRSHSLENLPKFSSGALFTGEKYSTDKHSVDQLSGHVWKGVPLVDRIINQTGWENLEDETYFLIGSKFVDEKMRSQFPDSVIVLGGCDTTSNKSLTKSLLARGASTVVGWDGLVNSDQNDIVILSFLEKVLIDKVEIKTAVKAAMEDYDIVEESPTLEYFTPIHVETMLI